MAGRPKKNISFCLENKPIIILVNDIIAKIINGKYFKIGNIPLIPLFL